MRGKLLKSSLKALMRRITPAHAGKTQKLMFQVPLPKDHPRACGENYLKLC